MATNESDIFVKARFVYASLPKAERGAADLLFDDGKAAAGYTLAEYAMRAGTSESSVIRFCRRIGAAGYAEFTELLQHASEAPNGHGAYRIAASDSVKTAFEKVARNYNDTLTDTLALYTPEYERALAAIRDARIVHFFGIGDAHLVCQAAQMKFTRVGKQSTAYSDSALMLATGSLAEPVDVIVAVSFSGQSRVLTNAVRLAKQNGATVVAILHNEKSTLGKLADISLFTATTDLTPTHDEIARRIAEHAIVDTLYMAMISQDSEIYGPRGEQSLSAIEAYK
ncbi:MurR/RpiR family transcriptional regulator [Herbiconiux moechotypicola]|uniref:MurR/RpiR family transcriptional regulator n=1 Tax=Herbiconiux moechotypicola TaxID=637393 RepID=A0ABN3DQF0_9MICO|nr:MurR/RpiR family transcriptional regulator [Herbiconiux moechotypicola]MCS5731670.1 MurR/RpiR family transcriptional regulator [Herbiconiux moechotypicola]